MKKLHSFHRHRFLPCRPPLPQGAGARGPGEAFWWSQGFGCSSTAPEQLSGQKYQSGDSAVPVPAPRAGSSRAGGCLPAHEVPGSWFWTLNSPSCIFSRWGRGGLGRGQDTLQQGRAWGAGICSMCWFPSLGQHMPALAHGEGGVQAAVAGGILQVRNVPGSKVPISAPRWMLAFSTCVSASANSKALARVDSGKEKIPSCTKSKIKCFGKGAQMCWGSC